MMTSIPSNFGKVVGNVLRAKRESLGMNRLKFANMTGVARTSVIHIENGYSPTTYTLNLIVKSTGLTWQEIGKAIDDEEKRIANDKLFNAVNINSQDN